MTRNGEYRWARTTKKHRSKKMSGIDKSDNTEMQTTYSKQPMVIASRVSRYDAWKWIFNTKIQSGILQYLHSLSAQMERILLLCISSSDSSKTTYVRAFVHARAKPSSFALLISRQRNQQITFQQKFHSMPFHFDSNIIL